MTENIPLILFAKAPIPGKVKTRLQSHCSPQQAAEIASILLDKSLQQATEYWPGPVHLSVWLDHDHPYLALMHERYDVTLVPQCDGDLGAKMMNGLDQFGYPAMVMGCDVPHITSDTLETAYRFLSAGEPVIGPSVDGGYYLLGLTGSAPALFANMPWGTSRVLEKTLKSAVEMGLNFAQLEKMCDVDEWQDLLSASRVVPVLSDYLDSQGLK